MKTALLCLSLLCGDITPEIDDRFESENQSSAQAVASEAPKVSSESISLAEAQKLKSVSADDVTQLTKSDGQEVTVLGQVHSVYIPKSGSPVILNLGKDFKSCTKAVVYDRSFQKWKLSAKEIGAIYEGKSLVIEGQVSLYKDLPQIELNGPAQIRIVK